MRLSGWEKIISGGGIAEAYFLIPLWGGAVRRISWEEKDLYAKGLAFPVPPGMVQDDFLKGSY